MGINFLKHIERTSALLHIIDVSAEPYTDAWENYKAINNELGLYNPSLAAKTSNCSLEQNRPSPVREKAKKEVALFKKNGIMLFEFSAVTGEGISKILNKIVSIIHKKKKETL